MKVKCIYFSCTIDDFLSKAREAYKKSPWELEYEQVPFDYPLNISFTSGTTGLPKRILHSTGVSMFILLQISKKFPKHLKVVTKVMLLTQNLFLD